MKHLIAIFLACIFAFSTIFANVVSAQAAETIWMETDKGSYGAGETVTVTLKANSVTPFQGFTFKLRYDPACLEPTVPASLLSGLNYMPVPQKSGLVSGIFANTSPLSANGALAEIKFKILTSCQSTLKLEKASLSISDASGMPVAIQGISLGASSLVVTTGGSEAALTQPTHAAPANPTIIVPDTDAAAVPALNLTPENTSAPSTTQFDWGSLLLGLAVLIVLIVAVFVFIRRRFPAKDPFTSAPLPQNPALIIKRGPDAGKFLPILNFPCRIGSSPSNEIQLLDTRIGASHAEILADQHGYTLVDLGSPDGTYLNGRLMNNQQAVLTPGDTVRMGGILLVFGQED